MAMRVYITGADGMLGTALRAAIEGSTLAAHWAVRSVSIQDFDIADASALRASVRDFRPDVVLHAAANAIVDDCESDPRRALRVNIGGTRNVAAECQAAGIRLLYISSDYVFDGSSPPEGGYREDCVPGPVNVYGLAKLAGEAIAAAVPRHLVVRTSWLFGGRDETTDQVLAMVRQILRGERPALIHDQFSCPTYTVDLAQVLLRLLASAHLGGVLHVANRGSASWYEVGLMAARELRHRGVSAAQDPLPLPLADCDFVGQRPRNSALCTARIASLGLELPHWSDALRRYCGMLLSAADIGGDRIGAALT